MKATLHRITFGRSFAFPPDANPTRVSAEFKEDVLTLHLVKDKKTKPQRIEITVS